MEKVKLIMCANNYYYNKKNELDFDILHIQILKEKEKEILYMRRFNFEDHKKLYNKIKNKNVKLIGTKKIKAEVVDMLTKFY